MKKNLIFFTCMVCIITTSCSNKSEQDIEKEIFSAQEGMKSQFNSGSISQRTSERLMYSIPALPGSSGSPVVNLQGKLVAINFARLNGTQSFNYSIRVKYFQKLMGE